jgi:hypothetical protein
MPSVACLDGTPLRGSAGTDPRRGMAIGSQGMSPYTLTGVRAFVNVAFPSWP